MVFNCNLTNLFVVIGLSFCLAIVCVEGKDTLRMVHVIYRHGDRAPISFFKNDPYANNSRDYWPEGLGQLTKRGKVMEYNLGTWLRNRYDNFISQMYLPDEIRVLSTDCDRTLMSAQCVLASFYYPDKESRFESVLSWLPTPIHTAPAGADMTLNVDDACPRVAIEEDLMLETQQVKDYLTKHADFFEFLSEKAGQKLESVMEVDFLYDTLKIEDIYNLTIPDWAIDNFDRLAQISAFSFAMNTLTPELKRLRGGPLVTLMRDNMVNQSLGNQVDQKMKMFSAHDSTVAAFLNTMGVYNNVSPPYAATVLVELHDIDGQFFVKTFYQNDSVMHDDAHVLTIPGCASDCPLEHWVKLMADVIPDNWDRECYRPDHVRDHYFIVTLAGLSSVLGACLMLLSAWLYVLYRCPGHCSLPRPTITAQRYEPLCGVTVATPQYGTISPTDVSSYNWSPSPPRSL